MAAKPPSVGNITLGADILTDFEAASRREWLVTNGIGGYASGSLSGANTRRYHGLLVAALTPPTGRFVLLSKIEESVQQGENGQELASNQYPGAVYPQGHRFLERFDLLPAPTFRFRPFPNVCLEKTVWMARGQNTTYLRYTLVEADAPVTLTLAPLVCWKDYHAEMHPWEGFPQSLDAAGEELHMQATPDAPLLHLYCPGGDWQEDREWHYTVEHLREQERGLDAQEDLYQPGRFALVLAPNQSVTLTVTIEPTPLPAAESWDALLKYQQSTKTGKTTDAYRQTLTLAADAFVVDATVPKKKSAPAGAYVPTRSTLLAGYHWFTDWGRDTMIALPGLCLTTGRTAVARDILVSFARYVSQGMLPNRFPDKGSEPEYNTVDATLWYFEAIRAYTAQAEDGEALARDLWATLTDIVRWHLKGTRYGIGVDAADDLLRAGEPGVQLTWMDAKVGDWVVTPRIGKPVEINALWYNALRVMQRLAETLQLAAEAADYGQRADRVKAAFRAAFVRPDGLGLYDVIGEAGADTAIRPNQIFAVSLPYSPLEPAEQQQVVAVVERELLTPYGLRTLSAGDPAYRGHYGGDTWQRDGAYHQGTVWAWLLGGFAIAHHRVHGDAAQARALLLPLQAHLSEAGVGSISEIFDGDVPHAPNGCIAQAWSVAEVLRAWAALEPGN